MDVRDLSRGKNDGVGYLIGILHAGDLNSVSLGGISEYVRQFIQYAEGEVHLYGTLDDQEFKRSITTRRMVNDQQFLFTPLCSNRKRPISLFYSLHLLFMLIFRREKFRDIHLFYAQRIEFVLPFILFRKKQPVMVAIHGSSAYATQYWGKVKAMVYLALEKIAIRRANRVVILNSHPSFGLPYYQKRYSQYHSKLAYAKVPVDSNIFTPIDDKLSIRAMYSMPETDPIIIYFGRVEHNPKRVLLFPEILQIVRRDIPNCHLVIVGDGDDAGALCERLRQMNLTDFVQHVEYQTDRQHLAELVACADVSMVISSFEGICMSALESLSAGVPVVATEVGELPNYIINGINGMLVPNTSNESQLIQQVACALVTVLKNRRCVGHAVPEYEATGVFTELVGLYP